MPNILVKWVHYLWLFPNIWEIHTKIHMVTVIVETNEGAVWIFSSGRFFCLVVYENFLIVSWFSPLCVLWLSVFSMAFTLRDVKMFVIVKYLTGESITKWVLFSNVHHLLYMLHFWWQYIMVLLSTTQVCKYLVFCWHPKLMPMQISK